MINPLKHFFSSEGHVALDRNPGGNNTILLRLIPGDLLSACSHRQFHTLLDLLDSWAALPNSNPNALHAMLTRPGREPTTYGVRGGHANHLANLTLCITPYIVYNARAPPATQPS